VFWYPGVAGENQHRILSDARRVGTVLGHRISIANQSPDDGRIHVHVEKDLCAALFWLEPSIQFDRFAFVKFEEHRLPVICDLLAEHELEIREAWRVFRLAARQAQLFWRDKLNQHSGS
jgi:hypothetical protein